MKYILPLNIHHKLFPDTMKHTFGQLGTFLYKAWH